MSSALEPENTTPAKVGDSQVSRHSRVLAANLYNHLGLKKALRICEDNQWYSVVTALEDIHCKRRG
ncbi:hypothetical protein GCM10017044_09110 [Kordiimonas sediminis]|uniref:Uncharacterized protein n=1 Tax=Kordiimonas sediminis TaxID=1735581 RepID=A0A919ANA4_9PROT|nr:hypothetical protein [Kordiimonas sediminis]GHF16933.1 hypothetical protein GCM10017044_09110 [Kordiimonas sediminis]